jgi:hypothetical protein
MTDLVLSPKPFYIKDTVRYKNIKINPKINGKICIDKISICKAD